MDDDEAGGVVLRQTMLQVDEVFLYSLPTMKTAGGHRAEDWNLAKPIETCSLVVQRCDDELQLTFRKQSDDSVFARSVMDLNAHDDIQYYCEEVVDSSRYFCIRINDDKSGREARIGMGFRERDYASNFRMSLQDYQASLRRERKAHELQEAYAATAVDDPSGGNHDSSSSNLSLKQGEKIHVNRGGKSTITRGGDGGTDGSASNHPSSSPILLKKPPPSPAQQEELRISLEEMQIPDASEGNDDDDEDDSDCAVADDDDHDSLN